MPAPAVPRIRCTLYGQIGPGAWRSSVYLHQITPSMPTQSDLDAAANSISGLWNAHGATPLQPFNDGAESWDGVELDYIPASSMATAINSVHAASAVPGSAGHVSSAAQCVVASLYTAVHSKSGRGRMYLPATGDMPGGIDAYGFHPADTSALCTAVAAWLTAVNTFAYASTVGILTAVVQSLTTASVNPITKVFVDTRPDRHIHREKAQLQSRFSATV